MKAGAIVGIILIALGVLALIYQGITYTSEETVLEVGPVEVEAQEQRTIPLPPILGGLAIVGGAALVLTNRGK